MHPIFSCNHWCSKSAEISTETGWMPGQLSGATMENQEKPVGEPSTIVLAQPKFESTGDFDAASVNTNIEDYVDIDFSKNTTEDVRYNDMAVTIFQRNS